jgi:hypothetical protein
LHCLKKKPIIRELKDNVVLRKRTIPLPQPYNNINTTMAARDDLSENVEMHPPEMARTPKPA